MEAGHNDHWFSFVLYTDALKPASLLSLTLQDDEIDMAQGISHILKLHNSLKKLTTRNPAEWPVTKVALSKLNDENGGKVYQGAELHGFRDSTIKNLPRLSSSWFKIT